MAVLVALGSFLATLAGGAVAVRLRDERHLVLGLAAGVMLGVVFFDLLPEALELSPRPGFGPSAATVTAVAGFLSLHVGERIALRHGAHHDRPGHDHGLERIGLTAAGGLVLHSTLDGVGIGAAFQGGTGVGVAVAIAVIAHDL